MKKENIKHNTRFFTLMIMLMLVFSFIVNTDSLLVSAETNYTNVITDLSKDESFDIENYPIIENDYSLQVVTVAESVNKELFVYVYQPSASLQATSVNIATGYRNKTYTNYSLTYLNGQDALQKYIVNNFTVSEDATRYYEISSIFRAWDENIDEQPEEDQTVSEVSFAVGKQYVITDNSMECTDIELIKITDKHVGFVRYFGGASYWGAVDYVDSHYLAFSTDKKIDKLLEADVFFQTQSKLKTVGQTYSFGEQTENYTYMTGLSTVHYQSDYTAWGNPAYEWDRIQSKDDFVQSEDFSKSFQMGILNIETDYSLSEETKETIKNCDWVLRFFESKYEIAGSGLVQTKQWTSVTDVSVLRLKFETSGIVYNLGVIDNKQSGDGMPDNEMKISVSFSWPHLIGLFFIVLLVLLLIFEPKIIFGLIKGIWWTITSPLEIFDGD